MVRVGHCSFVVPRDGYVSARCICHFVVSPGEEIVRGLYSQKWIHRMDTMKEVTASIFTYKSSKKSVKVSIFCFKMHAAVGRPITIRLSDHAMLLLLLLLLLLLVSAHAAGNSELLLLLLLVVGCWLLVVVGCWLLLVVGCCWLLVVGCCCRLLLKVVGGR